MRTITSTSCDLSLVEPFLIQAGGPEGKGRHPVSLDRPLPTVITENHTAVVQPAVRPFIVPNFGEREGQAPRTHSVDAPLPAVTSHGAGALVQATLTSVSGSAPEPPLSSARCQVLYASGDTTAVKQAAAEHPDCTPYRLDLDLRMLKPRELARAQGFEDSYVFTGNHEAQVKQIGNAVPPGTAKALILQMLAPDNTASSSTAMAA